MLVKTIEEPHLTQLAKHVVNLIEQQCDPALHLPALKIEHIHIQHEPDHKRIISITVTGFVP